MYVANLGVKLDLKQIALRCRNTEFNPKRFGAVIMRLREPRATALIFASGKMCVTGTKSAHNSVLASKKFCYIIEKVGREIRVPVLQTCLSSCSVYENFICFFLSTKSPFAFSCFIIFVIVRWALNHKNTSTSKSKTWLERRTLVSPFAWKD